MPAVFLLAFESAELEFSAPSVRIAHRDAEFWGDVGKQIERSLEEA